jgi:hypothetical protein
MKTLGKQIDALKTLDDEIKAQSKILQEMKSRRYKMETRLLKDFESKDIEGCKGKKGVARVRRATFYSIKDRRKFEKYVLKHRALDLFQNRISAEAYKARLDEGEKVPGITSFDRFGITVTKRGAK